MVMYSKQRFDVSSLLHLIDIDIYGGPTNCTVGSGHPPTVNFSELVLLGVGVLA